MTLHHYCKVTVMWRLLISLMPLYSHCSSVKIVTRNLFALSLNMWRSLFMWCASDELVTTSHRRSCAQCFSKCFTWQCLVYFIHHERHNLGSVWVLFIPLYQKKKIFNLKKVTSIKENIFNPKKVFKCNFLILKYFFCIQKLFSMIESFFFLIEVIFSRYFFKIYIYFFVWSNVFFDWIIKTQMSYP